MLRTIDDIDGMTPADTYQLSINGYSLAIDLGSENWDKMAEALAPYFKAGRIGKGRCPHPALARVTDLGDGEVAVIPPQPHGPRDHGPRDEATKTVMAEVAADNKTIRDWWFANEGKAKLGLPEYKAKGVIPATVKDAFNTAHQPA